MSTDLVTTDPATTESELRIYEVPAEDRADFDERFRELTGAPTPVPMISFAIIAYDQANNVAGAAYAHVRHLLAPWSIAEGAPPDTLSRIADAVTAKLQLLAGGPSARHGDAGDALTERFLSYDIYVPSGQAAPEGFERLPVEVWRRRVLWHGVGQGDKRE